MQLLKVVVIAMGTLIAAGIGVIVYTLIERGAEQFAGPAQGNAPGAAPASAAPSGAGSVRTPSFGEARLGLPAGSRVEQMVVSGDRLVVSVLVPGEGERIVVIDLSSGRPLGSVALEGAR